MQELDHIIPTEEIPTIELPTETGTARLQLPADASDDEVAALIAAISAKLGEESATEGPGDTRVPESNRWKLAGRLGARTRFDLPRECRQGGEWMAAGRGP
ncbi:MAG: hypothetical protein ACI8UR_000358 [Natronomonas sp.]|uniref:acc operon protein n=1 Tax=Natronomonas sp. TaxID=2184060 RepID=UPI0039895FFA